MFEFPAFHWFSLVSQFHVIDTQVFVVGAFNMAHFKAHNSNLIVNLDSISFCYIYFSKSEKFPLQMGPPQVWKMLTIFNQSPETRGGDDSAVNDEEGASRDGNFYDPLDFEEEEPEEGEDVDYSNEPPNGQDDVDADDEVKLEEPSEDSNAATSDIFDEQGCVNQLKKLSFLSRVTIDKRCVLLREYVY